LAVVALIFTSCNQKELDAATKSRDSLALIVKDRDSSLNDFIQTFNDVEKNLDAVASKQHIVSQAAENGELKGSQKERINSEIEAINKLMDENREQIAQLTGRLKSAGRKNALLEKSIATLNAQLDQKYLELADLNKKLDALNVQVAQLTIDVDTLHKQVDTLTSQNNTKAQIIAEETAALHTAYYIVDKRKALQDAKLIDRKGGMLGIGKSSSLSSNFDNSKFTKIDYTVTTTIEVNAPMKIITSHPTDSYKLDLDPANKNIVKSITIYNAEKFWSASKYLVVIKN
jgi:uncharacterized coiled-coil protein SlyX